MPKLIRLIGGAFTYGNDPFVILADEEPVPQTGGAVIVSLARFQAEGEALLKHGRSLGVRLEPDQPVEGIADDLPRLALVALAFPKFRDGRPYTSATLVRERYGFTGELRAVGDVLCDQANFMVRCGFDAFEPADDATPDKWARSAGRFRHVYQAAADHRPAAFAERAQAPSAQVREG